MHSICAIRILLHIRQDAQARRIKSDSSNGVNFTFSVRSPHQEGEPTFHFSDEIYDVELAERRSHSVIGGTSDQEIEEHWFDSGRGRGEDMV